MTGLQDILQQVTTYGLAVVIIPLLVYLIYKISVNHKEEIKTITNAYELQLKELHEKYDKKVDGFTDAINNNTRVMEKFLEVAHKAPEIRAGDQ